jgi:tetratricopeptide (TPR) repeat protein
MNEQPAAGTKKGRRVAPRRRWPWALLALFVLLGLGGTALLARPRPDPMRLLLLATAEYEQGLVDRAESLLNERRGRAGPTALDWILRARIAEARVRPDDAVRHLDNVPDSDRLAGQARLLAGQIELDRDSARLAEAALKRAVTLDPSQVVAHRELAYIYAMQHRQVECDGEFRTLAALTDLDYQRAFIWCQNACDIWNPEEARARLERFLSVDPDDRRSRLALALCHVRSGKPELTEKVLAPLDSTDADALAIRAEIALARGDQAAAETLAASGPADHPQLNLLRGRLELGRHEPESAIEHFRRVLGAIPGNRDALHGMGQALRMRGDHDAAQPYLDQVNRHDALRRLILDVHPQQATDPGLFFKLGAACEAIPLPREAATWYRLAIARDPLDAEAQKALARVSRPR